ncbi:MAG TPA: hypothetical protein PLT86_10830, partial [Candidatus Latescibacteria bacterium]|nr:hypothetical protein [Candidatus Latescibacterota bacterium]
MWEAAARGRHLEAFAARPALRTGLGCFAALAFVDSRLRGNDDWGLAKAAAASARLPYLWHTKGATQERRPWGGLWRRWWGKTERGERCRSPRVDAVL